MKSKLPVERFMSFGGEEVINKSEVARVRELMPPAEDFAGLAELYKMFSDPTRVKVLYALRCGSLCVCDLAAVTGMTKSAISHQLKSLRMADLVKNEKAGRVVTYSLADEQVSDILDKGFAHIRGR